MVNIKTKITRKRVVQLLLFAAVIGMATLFDIYFDKNEAEFEEIEAGTSKSSQEQHSMFLISQSQNCTVKTFEQKVSDRKIQVKAHDRFIQKYYQLRNYQVLKAEIQKQTTPLINIYHYLAFKNYFFSDPDDIPFNS